MTSVLEVCKSSPSRWLVKPSLSRPPLNLRKLLSASHFLIPHKLTPNLKLGRLTGHSWGENREISSLSPGNFDYLTVFVGYKYSSDKSFVGENFRNLTKIMSLFHDEVFPDKVAKKNLVRSHSFTTSAKKVWNLDPSAFHFVPSRQDVNWRRPGPLLNILCTFNLRPMSTGWKFGLLTVEIFKKAWNVLTKFWYSDEMFSRNIFSPLCSKSETSMYAQFAITLLYILFPNILTSYQLETYIKFW